MKPFEYERPKTIKEACGLFRNQNQGAKILAGGTDLLVQLKNKALHPEKLISLRDVKDLSELYFDEIKGISIGATVSLSEIEDSKEINSNYPAISQAASTIGSIQVRNRATIGGNICNASPSADMVPILISYGAKVLLTDGSMEREVLLKEFFVGPGQTVLKSGEILKAIIVPSPAPASFAIYLKSSRTALDLAIVGVGLVVAFDKKRQVQNINLTLGAVAPTPLYVEKVENIAKSQPLDEQIIEKICKIAVKTASPISDVRASAQYRKSLIAVYTRRALIHASMWVRKGDKK